MKYFILIIGFFSILNAQTADEIIDKHFENSGGEKAWNKLINLVITGEVAIDISETVPIKIEHRRPYYKRVSFLIDGKEQLSEGYDGKNAFTYNPTTDKNMAIPNYKPDAFETDFFKYKSKGFTAEYLGEETIEQENAYKIKLTKNKTEVYYWFSTTDYRLIQEKTDLETISYSNHEEFDGLRFAMRMEYLPLQGKPYVIIFHDIKTNVAIPDSRFKFD